MELLSAPRSFFLIPLPNNNYNSGACATLGGLTNSDRFVQNLRKITLKQQRI